MNRNQKIALGCGGAGCLGLIVLLVVGSVVYMIYWKSSSDYTRKRNSSYNINSGRNSNSSAYPDSSTNSSDESPSSSMSDDDKHKLFQAASGTQDSELIQRVQRKLGLLDASGAPADEYAEFAKDHVIWLFKNTDFLQSVNTPEKARAYVEEHIDD